VKKAIALLALAAGLGLFGCGGSDEEPLTKAEFRKQATAICEESRQERYEMADALSSKGEPDKKQLKKLIQEEYIPSFRAMFNELRELNPPEAEAEQFETVLANLEAATDDAEANFGQTKSLFAASQEAEKMGLGACGF
jgi:hypothetical protein